MAFTGDTKVLDVLRRRLAKVKSAEFRKRLASVCGQEALSRVLEGFAASKDPYGQRWKPLKVRQGQPLLDRGMLRNSISVRMVGEGFKLATNNVGAPVHQHGAVIRPKNAKMLHFRIGKRSVWAKSVTIPARPFLPDSRGLPRGWASGFRDVAGALIRAELGHNARTTRLGAL
jgi:phage gpG-like protein